MAITYLIENLPEFLKVTAKGKDDNLEDVTGYVKAIISAAKQYKCSRILCDERRLEYNISITDTYRLAEIIANETDIYIKVAIVCDSRFLQDGKFFETAAFNRGISVLVCTEYTEAEHWLAEPV